MRYTKYELTELRDTDRDIKVAIKCNLPMNTPLMLVRTKGNRLGFKRLNKLQAAPRIKQPEPPEQTSLL